MAWEKRGFIYKPSGEAEWMKSHAQVPTALLLEDRIRIYITVRPEQQLSLITFIDVDIKDPTKILYVHKEPLLELGKPGTFDEFGTMCSMVMHVEDEVWLYYNGWQRGATVPYINAVGLAISKDGGKTFKRAFDGPVLTVTPNEPYSAMSPSIIRQGDTWHMWHGSGTGWVEVEGKYEPLYCIYYSHSQDGINWQRPNICCIPPLHAEEANSRPSVVYENGIYHMWFSYRDSRNFRLGDGSYRIGYASSQDGINWQRDDSKAGIKKSTEGWDSVMATYPNILTTPHGRYMFYNGNGFGESGFGYAVWKDKA